MWPFALKSITKYPVDTTKLNNQEEYLIPSVDVFVDAFNKLPIIHLTYYILTSYSYYYIYLH